MNAVTRQLPVPAGAGFVIPARRARVDVWAAPDPETLVLDPWAAPVGRPVALAAVSPWSPPVGQSRVRWMASPAALLPAPTTPTGRGALATLRSLAETPVGPFPPAPGVERAATAPDSLLQRPPLSPPTWTAPAFAPPDPATLVGPTTDDPVGEHEAAVDHRIVGGEPAVESVPENTTVDREREGVQWRLVAMVSGVGAATAAVVTLLSALF